MELLDAFVDGIQAMTGATRPGIAILLITGGILQKILFQSKQPASKPSFS